MIKQYVVPIDLRASDITKFTGLTDIIRNTLDFFKDSYKYVTLNKKPVCNNDFEVILACNAGRTVIYDGSTYRLTAQKFRELLAKAVGWNPHIAYNSPKKHLLDWNPYNLKVLASKAMDIIRERNKLFVYNKAKSDAVFEILMNFKVKTIILNGSNEMAEYTANHINQQYGSFVAYTAHSNTKSSAVGKYGTNLPVVDANGKIVKYGMTRLAKYVKKVFEKESFVVLVVGKSIPKEFQEPEYLENIEFEQCISTYGDTKPFDNIRYFSHPITETKMFNVVFNSIPNYFSNDLKQLNKRLETESKISNITWLNSLSDIRHI